MAIQMPADTRDVLKANAERCDSRSLFMDRFAQPDARETVRKAWFDRLIRMAPVCIQRQPIGTGPQQPPVYGQLLSRLMVNMAGGAMENAGLCLDRFGLPYIPGAAVKGCARRTAIQHLLEAGNAGEKTALLVQIALTFGWGEQDWSDSKKDGRFKSDFAYAVGGALWPGVAADARNQLPATSHFAGQVSFLSAHPVNVPGAQLPSRVPALGALELDVLTCHHQKYYQDPKRPATDDEPPNPVLFPAAAAGHVFAFVVLPMRGCAKSQLDQARQWLAAGLSTFGLGAKTAAGYGWFDCSEQVQSRVSQSLEKIKLEEDGRRKAEAEANAKKLKDADDLKKREEFKAAMASLSPEQQEDCKIAQLTPDQFRSALDNFASKNPEEQKAIVRALRIEPGNPGSRRASWVDLKTKAANKGGKTAQTEQEIRKLSKTMFPGKQGKMP